MEWLEGQSWAKLVAAEKLAAAAVAHAPQAAAAWQMLILSKKRLGKMAQAREIVAQASAAIGEGIAERKAFFAALLKAEEYEAALAEGERLPPDDDVRTGMRQAALASNRLDPAQRRVLADEDHTVNQAWSAAVTVEDLHRLVETCRATLVEYPIHSDARCIVAHALAKLGEDDAARAAMALDKFLWTGTVAGDSAEARTAMAAELRQNPTLVPDPHNKSTRDGLQAAKIGLPNEPAVQALLARIKTAVEQYRTAMESIDDPFITRAPRKARLHPWAVIYGASGRQTAHRHPAGWLSGVYYVSAPRTAEGYRGALLVGEPDKRLAKAAPWGVKRLEPVPGRLVLFPSFVTHATEPCGADGERISLAFDVIPAGT